MTAAEYFACDNINLALNAISSCGC